MKGIDVSTHQQNVDWAKVADSGFDFAMIKATQGRGEGASTKHLKMFTDSKFKRNIVGASEAGLAVGVYHYFTATTDAQAEAEARYFIEATEPYRGRITLWHAVDVESDMYLSGLSKDALAARILAFMKVLSAHGLKVMLYTNPDYLTYKLPRGAFDGFHVWLAHYAPKPMSVPNTMIWQYTSTGRVPGIRTSCDINEGYFPEALCALSKLSSHGVISSPTYWVEHYADVKYLDVLIVRAADKLGAVVRGVSSLDEALYRLVKTGVIDSPGYWREQCGGVRYLPELLMKLGGAV